MALAGIRIVSRYGNVSEPCQYQSIIMMFMMRLIYACVCTHAYARIHTYTHLSASLRAHWVWYLGATLLRIAGRPVSTVGVARSIRGNAASNGSHACALVALAVGDVAEISRKDGAEVG